MEKRCLIIDNDDQSATIEKLIRDAQKKGIQLNCEQFNIGSTSYDEVLTNGRIDSEKVLKECKKNYRKRAYQLIAFDWDLSDTQYSGVEIIRLFNHNKLFEGVPKLLYSGVLDEHLATVIDEFKNEKKSRNDLIAYLKVLIRVDIVDFVKRDNYEQEILKTLLNQNETVDMIVEDELRKFPDARFRQQFVSSSFSGKRFSELADLLAENDQLATRFKKELIQQVINYISDLSE